MQAEAVAGTEVWKASQKEQETANDLMGLNYGAA